MVVLNSFVLLTVAAALLSSAHSEAQPESQARHEPTFGLSVWAHATGCWEVTSVARDSKAATCHIRREDLICSVNGKPALFFSSSEIGALPQQTGCSSLARRKHVCVAFSLQLLSDRAACDKCVASIVAAAAAHDAAAFWICSHFVLRDNSTQLHQTCI
jgi:hypothetical protein